jgi:hypothetical protein
MKARRLHDTSQQSFTSMEHDTPASPVHNPAYLAAMQGAADPADPIDDRVTPDSPVHGPAYLAAMQGAAVQVDDRVTPDSPIHGSAW